MSEASVRHVAASGDDVIAYLKEVFAFDSASSEPVREALASLAALRSELASAPLPAYSALAAWRLLASNSLVDRNAPGRAGWDAANAVLGEALGHGESPTVALATRLHAALGVGSSAIRTSRIFTADEEYLPPELVPTALALLDDALAVAEDPVDRAFRAYVGLVTIHPFENGNGRASRLLADHALLGGGLLPLCFASPVSSHVALTMGGAPRSIAGSLLAFTSGIERAYLAVLGRGGDRGGARGGGDRGGGDRGGESGGRVSRAGNETSMD